ncbi:MAG: helix-turn-helix transcriptional regulator [Woeseiaceae bacterium]|jgi:putative transcriptional regulator|nr:helix-turn-helix transcriptional regulator [Woeseiaceae bacterium]
MDYYSLSDSAIEAEIGARLKALRLRRNLTQQTLADAAGLSVTAIKGIESGRGRLATLIAVLRELAALDQLEHFIPAITVSPLQLARRKGVRRQRATGSRGKPDDTNAW